MKRRDQEKPQDSQGVPRPSDSKVDDITSITHSSASDKNSILACSTRVNPSRKHGVGPLGGDRKVWGVRIDEKLKKRVAPKLKHFWGSHCRAIETWLMAWEVSYDEMLKQIESTVNRGHTSIEIKELHVVRAQAPRRKLDVDDPIAYSLDETTIIEETVNRFSEKYRQWSSTPNRMDVLRWILLEHPNVDGKTRITLTRRIMKHLQLIRAGDQK